MRVTLMLAAAVVAVGCLFAVAYVTLTPSPRSVPESHTNLDPGETLRFYLDRPSVRAAVIQLGGNLLLLMPLGALLPVALRPLRGPLRILGATGVVSLVVEGMQGLLAVGRSFDIDDVILNAAGAVIAYMIVGRPLARWVHSRGSRSQHTRRSASKKTRA